MKLGATDCSHGARSPCGAEEDASTERGGHSAAGDIPVFTWLNLVCLDAPLVAISWQWLFARNFEIQVARGGTAALFLTAWLIYLADRFGDSLSANFTSPLSLRQRFCLRHRGAWMVGIVSVALADVFVIAQMDRGTIRTGVIVGLFAFVYLVVNQRWPLLWRTLPLKELSIGFLFAAGTRVGLAAGLTGAALPGWFLFACLCALNCISIALWERDMDVAQNRVSIATVFPDVQRLVTPVLILLATGSFWVCCLAAGRSDVYSCVGVSALLLGGVHFLGRKIAPDTRTALADLVLLTPVLWILR